VQWPLEMLTLVLALAQFSWMTLIAVAVKVISLTAHIAPVSAVLMATQKMLEFDVKVCLGCPIGSMHTQFEDVCIIVY